MDENDIALPHTEIFLKVDKDTKNPFKIVDGQEECSAFFHGEKIVTIQDKDNDIDIEVEWSQEHIGRPHTEEWVRTKGAINGHFSCKFGGKLFASLEQVPLSEMPDIQRT